ncbi:MAG: N-acetylgalactosamine-6-sulfatase, partial [Verrucomicrobiota bacterium]
FWKSGARWPPRKETPYHWVSYVVMHENWKLLTSEEGEHTELYDLVADPLEKTDFAKEKPEIVATLEEKLEEWKAALPSGPRGDVFSAERAELKE